MYFSPLTRTSFAGFGVGAVTHPGGRAVLQRARLRALPRDAKRHPELAGIRRQHPAGYGQVGHAGADAQPLTVLQRGNRHALIGDPSHFYLIFSFTICTLESEPNHTVTNAAGVGA